MKDIKDGYRFSIERGDLNYGELEPNYRRHYEEMTERLAMDGVTVSPYAPRLDAYFRAFREGWLINYVARHDGAPIGHSNIYLTQDMHNGDPIAQEDMIYVVPEHRNGTGRRLTKFILADLQARGCKRLIITTTTDERVAKIWPRLGFKPCGTQMIREFGD